MSMELWNAVAVTNPNFVKSFARVGGFSGTAINATYQAQKATETFGPCGIGWGIDILEERYQDTLMTSHFLSSLPTSWGGHSNGFST